MKHDLPAMIRAKGQRRQITFRPIEPTQALQLELYRIARRVLDLWTQEIAETILPLYERERAMLTQDDAADRVGAVIASTAEGASRLVVSLTPALQSWIVRIERWHRGRWTNGITASTGLDVSALVANLTAAEEVAAFQQWASGLIRDINEDMRRRVESATFRGVAERTPRRKIAKELAEALQITRRRAKFIAEDQTLKLSGKMDELRAREAGVDEYRWETARDERVRPTHRANQGKVFSWDKPPAVTGHPRTEPRCRCTAQPWIPLLEEFQPAELEGAVLA